MPSPAWTRKDLVSIADLTADEITLILDHAAAFKRQLTAPPGPAPLPLPLQGQTLVNLFIEPSTRTRISFEAAALRLGANVINVSASASSLVKGETLKDTALNIEALLADLIVIRHSSPGSAHFLAQRLRASIVNGGDGAHEHPTQALLDLFTAREERQGNIAGLHLVIVGDILFSRVARSDIHAFLKLGARVTLVGPPTLVPPQLAALGASISHTLDPVLPSADIIYLLRIQQERQREARFPSLGEYTSLFGLTPARAALLPPHCLIMHPGPINRGVEIDSDVADGPRNVILDQVTNGLAVRMAVLHLCSAARRALPGIRPTE